MSENQIKSTENNVSDASLLNHLAKEGTEENFEVRAVLIN